MPVAGPALPHLLGRSIGELLSQPLIRVMDERLLRRGERLIGFVGIFIGKLLKREAAAGGDLHRAGDRFLIAN